MSRNAAFPLGTLHRRFPIELAKVLAAQGMNPSFIEAEVAAMHVCAMAKTANRSVVGMLNEFSFLATAYRQDMDPVTLPIKATHRAVHSRGTVQ